MVLKPLSHLTTLCRGRNNQLAKERGDIANVTAREAKPSCNLNS